MADRPGAPEGADSSARGSVRPTDSDHDILGSSVRPRSPLPEVADGGVVTGASKSSRPPPLPPGRRRARRDDSGVDQELDALLAAEPGDLASALEGEEPPSRSLKVQTERRDVRGLSAICMYGRYEVLGRIAFGGMAEIFLGRETTSVGASRYLVIKRILPHVADDDQFVEMFLDEARLAIQLNHPNICHIYEFGELEDSYFIAMEWVNGVPLGKLIRKARLIGGVPVEIGARIVAQIAEALHHAHRSKDALGRAMEIVHRDVSPHNAMIAYDGQVKLLDFGIAKATTHVSKTAAGVVKGKFSYMAPEQCLGKDIDARADVFALGICLYETLTGKSLYHRENEYETMRAVIHEAPPSMQAVHSDIPTGLDEIVQKALAKEPEDRFQSAGDMQQALERWLADARKVVNAARVAELMDELYEEQIQRGPLVDSTPFGQSFQRRKRGTGAGAESGESAVVASSATAAATPAAAPGRSPALYLGLAAALVVVGLAAGYALFGQPPPAPAEEPAAAVVEPEDLEVDPEETAEATVEPVTTPEPEPEVVPATGTLAVVSTPTGAMVRVDGERVEGTTPLTLPDLSPGVHAVVVERSGYRSWEGEIEVVAGEEVTATATLRPAARAAAGPPGRLSINTRPWSKVYVGRRLLGTTPIAEARVTSGAVRLRLVDRDGRTHTKTVRVGAGSTERVFYNLDN